MEQTRKIVRRFNDLYGKGTDILTEPKALLSSTPRLLGLDGNAKMGKSLGNAIYLSDDETTVTQKVHSAVTDTNRISVKDKGNPEVCTVSKYHQVFNPSEYENICEMCRNAKIGCVACKKLLAENLNTLLDPIRKRRNYYENHLKDVKEIIHAGTEKANAEGAKTLHKVKSAMNLLI